MRLSRVAGLAAILHATALLSAASAAPPRTELLSITGLRLAQGDYVSAFKLDTWTVRVLAVCHLPFGWSVTAGTFGDPGGVLSGSANIGVAFLDRKQTGALGDLFLVQVGQNRTVAITGPNGERWPATFAGSVTVGRYGPDNAEHQVALSPRNLRRQPAARCPAPRP